MYWRFSALPSYPAMDPHTVSEYSTLHQQNHIKQEPFDHVLPSTPPPATSGAPHSSGSSFLRSTSSTEEGKSYRIVNRPVNITSSRDTMSGSSYTPWSSSGRRPTQGERSGSEDPFPISQQYMSQPYLNIPDPSSTSSSNLNAWNNPPQMQTNVAITMGSSAHPGFAGPGGLGMPFSGMGSGNEIPSNYPFNAPMQGHNTMGYPGPQMTPYQAAPSSSTSGSKDEEIQRLRRRIQELERELNQARPATSSPHYAAFQSSWRARTEARKRIYCSLNRAGNALCAWHDSRRERRAFPPRNAPPGHLNCGCTFEEALFEQSLARHGVGSYLPGDNVRMDPALRNPLLRLLGQRYGYKDGDFDHNPNTLTWAAGESPADWEKKAQSGAVIKRRADSGN